MGGRRRVGARAGAGRPSGLLDDRAGFNPEHPVVRELHRDADGLRLPRTQRVLEAVVPAVLSQRVTGFEAKRSFRQLVERWGEPAPGPGGLLLPPTAALIAELGLLRPPRRRGGEEAGRRPQARLRPRPPPARTPGCSRRPSFGPGSRRSPGSGSGRPPRSPAWRSGDADAVSVGDFHLKHLVSHALAGEPRGTDARMLELLEPFARPPRPGVPADRVGGHHRAAVRAPQRGSNRSPGARSLLHRDRVRRDVQRRLVGVDLDVAGLAPHRRPQRRAARRCTGRSRCRR